MVDEGNWTLVQTRVVRERIAIVTLCNSGHIEDRFSWGTLCCEHRFNLLLIDQLHAALDTVLSLEHVAALVLVGEGKFFSNGLDLAYLSQFKDSQLQKRFERLLARLLCFPLPTVGAINGHVCAGGAMFGLSLDLRVMNSQRGFFFVPGIDLGIAYSPAMTHLMKAKIPVHMHTEFICLGRRYSGKELENEHVVNHAVAPDEVLPLAVDMAFELTKDERFRSVVYRATLSTIKQTTFKEAFETLNDEEGEKMDFKLEVG